MDIAQPGRLVFIAGQTASDPEGNVERAEVGLLVVAPGGNLPRGALRDDAPSNSASGVNFSTGTR